jgi:hypothetical protein
MFTGEVFTSPIISKNIIAEVMSNPSLLKQCALVYKQMQEQIEDGASHASNETKWIEWAFGISVQTWFNIEKILDSCPFADEKEEIGFYKNLMPQFIGLIDYFTLLYKSVVFQPDDGTMRSEYWLHELRNCRDFISLCKTGCWYYEQHGIGKDFCLREQNSRRTLVFGVNINHRNITTTSYSHLQGRTIALKKYMHYIKERKMNADYLHSKQQEAGMSVKDLAREHGISEATFYN